MLTCKVGEGVVNTFTYKEEKLREWSNKKMLKCPACGEDMVYCHGDYKVPYFRHIKNTDCPDIYSEGVTEEHLQGIKILYEWLQNQEGITEIELEKWLPETRQRPDIYFKKDGDRYAIEFQCSPISTKFNERRDLYKLAGIKDIWILGIDKYNYPSVLAIEKYINKNNLFEKKMKTIEMEILNCDYNLTLLDVGNNRMYATNNILTQKSKRSKGWNNKTYSVELKTTFDMNLKSNYIKDVLINDLYADKITSYDSDKTYFKEIVNMEVNMFRNLLKNDINIEITKEEILDNKYYIWFRDIKDKTYGIYYDYKDCNIKGFEFQDKKIQIQIKEKGNFTIYSSKLHYQFTINCNDIQIEGNEIIDGKAMYDDLKYNLGNINRTNLRNSFENNFVNVIKDIVEYYDEKNKNIMKDTYISINPAVSSFTYNNSKIMVQFGYVGNNVFDRTYITENDSIYDFLKFMDNFYLEVLETSAKEYDFIRRELIKISKHYRNNVSLIRNKEYNSNNYFSSNIKEPKDKNVSYFEYEYYMKYNNKKRIIINLDSILYDELTVNYSSIEELDKILKNIISENIRKIRYAL